LLFLYIFVLYLGTMKNVFIILAFIVAAQTACKKDTEQIKTLPGNVVENPKSVFEMNVPKGFAFQNQILVDLQFSILNVQDKPGKNVSLTIHTDLPEKGGSLLFKGKVDAQGKLQVKMQVPAFVKELVCNTSLLGTPENFLVPVQSASQTLHIGGSNPTFIKTKQVDSYTGYGLMFKSAAKFSSKSLPLGWNSAGVPNNLVSPRDVVSNDLINDIWATLPSRVSVAINKPALLDDNIAKRTITLTQAADVWVTFLTEGAGYRNTLFYYKYPKNNPPASAAAIDSLYIVYPNASLNNSGGGLLTGDKVFLGRFGADTVIAFGIAANGFNNTNATLGVGFGLLYAHKNFNPEADPNLRQHMVLLRDAASNKYIFGFEDILRNSSGCDHDFNDVLFYTTANPASAISTDSIVTLPPASDSDGDGVNDIDDEYPNDAARAFNSYYPGLNQYATAAFEDLWPYYGDYDLNDVVMDFNYQLVSNAQNQVKDVAATYVLRASGGQIEHAFAVEFPANASNINSLTGASLENGHTNAVVKIFDNIRSVQARWNTIPSEPYADTVVKQMRFTLTTPIAISTFGLDAYNPFIWGTSVGNNRGMEIHLPGKLPTALANPAYFGTGDDRTNVGQNQYYVSKDNLPWAILTPQTFNYPIEKADIVTAHLKFGQWAQSGGSLFSDWHQNKPGYRNNANIYVKP